MQRGCFLADQLTLTYRGRSLHSPGHELPVVTLSSIQGSLPCSKKETTSGFDMVRPGDEKIHTTWSQWVGSTIQTQDLVIVQKMQLQKGL
jgi:hypothetical protein